MDSFTAVRRRHRDFLSPDDAAAMTMQRHRQRTALSTIHAFYPPSRCDSIRSTRAPMPVENIHRIPPVAAASRKPVCIEYTSSLPEVMVHQRTRMPRTRSDEHMVDFRCLPDAVTECIMEQLRTLHTGPSSPSCSTCFMRDLVALQMSCRAWSSPAAKCLYSRIDITGNDSPGQLKKCKMVRGSRLKLLRRTLRTRRMLADMVISLNVPDLDIPMFSPNDEPNPAFDDYRNLVASVVMACPNLERLTGFYTFYNHEYDRLAHALSTRKMLKEHVWMIGENDDVIERSQKQLPPGLLDDTQLDQFLSFHVSWSKLESLMLCSPGAIGVLEHELFVQVFHALPSLKRLCVSSFDSDDFTDTTLLELPKLECLRLEECPGVTDWGISRWAASPAADHITNLSLIHQNVASLMTISKTFASLPKLSKFTIIQSDLVPRAPSELMIFQPVLASPTLRFLHWDIAPDDELTYHEGSHQTPNSHLALSILNDGFPKLVSLRAPQDVSPPGALQAVCRPASNGTVLSSSDSYYVSPADVYGSPLRRGRSLRTARVRAQSLIDTNSKTAREFMRIIVEDHSTSQLGSGVGDEEADSNSSSNYSATSSDGTDPSDLFSPIVDARSPDTDVELIESSNLYRDLVKDQDSSRDSVVRWKDGTSSSSSSSSTAPGHPPLIPPRSPLRPSPIRPLRLQTISLPSFIGRIVANTTTNSSSTGNSNSNSKNPDPGPPPRFYLRPDIPGFDGNGGVIGWGDLLRVNEKVRAEQDSSDEDYDEDDEGYGHRQQHRPRRRRAWIQDGCCGAWNRGRSGKRPLNWWRHEERSRRRMGLTVEIDHFF